MNRGQLHWQQVGYRGHHRQQGWYAVVMVKAGNRMVMREGIHINGNSEGHVRKAKINRHPPQTTGWNAKLNQ